MRVPAVAAAVAAATELLALWPFPAAMAAPVVTCGPPPQPHSTDSALSVSLTFAWDNASHPNTSEAPLLRGGVEFIFTLFGGSVALPRGPVAHLAITGTPYNVTTVSYPTDPGAGAASCKALCDAQTQCLSWLFNSPAPPTPQTCALLAEVGCPYEAEDAWAGAKVDQAACSVPSQSGVGAAAVLLQGPLPVVVQPPVANSTVWTAVATGVLTSLRPATLYFITGRAADDFDYQSLAGWTPYAVGVICSTTASSHQDDDDDGGGDDDVVVIGGGGSSGGNGSGGRPATALPQPAAAATRFLEVFRMTECQPANNPGALRGQRQPVIVFTLQCGVSACPKNEGGQLWQRDHRAGPRASNRNRSCSMLVVLLRVPSPC
jgi:hypothetical protein